MEIPKLDLPNAENAARAFRAALDTLSGPLFAVLDGGQFDDLEDELADAGITSRSLFLSGGDEDMRRDGPWLVALNNRKTSTRIEELALEKPCAVFWSCPEGEQALWRHLRSINEIMIPDDRIEGNDGKSGTPVKYERVLFRHWDPNVLGSSLSLLNAEQFARVFGPVNGIIMNATDYGGLKRAPRPNDLPLPNPGLLQIDPEQVEDLKEAMLHSSRLRIARYLKGNIPQIHRGLVMHSHGELRSRMNEQRMNSEFVPSGAGRGGPTWQWYLTTKSSSFQRFENLLPVERQARMSRFARSCTIRSTRCAFMIMGPGRERVVGDSTGNRRQYCWRRRGCRIGGIAVWTCLRIHRPSSWLSSRQIGGSGSSWMDRQPNGAGRCQCRSTNKGN
ncbi:MULTISPECIES: DUF4123 domain-containing protein [unclassified Phyllobacterium]|uniref:DUF4123 domain-containing protein n=1 Tax=unclassified Phyllobacterium TaxID=2638441 RepID=UPI003012DF71